MSEPREIELKLECEPSDLATLKAHPLLQDASEQGAADLSSTYFDTAEQDLREAGLGLRVRRIGDRYVQTLKAEVDGLFRRPEWEQEVSDPEPDLAVLGDTPLDEILGRKDELQPLFTTSVKRQTYLVEQGSSRIEVALDSGRIEAPAAGDRIIPICEVELELKQGTAGDVFALSQAIAALAPLRLGVRSKAERGYSLASGKLDRVRKAERVPLREDMSAAAAFQAVAHACLRHMRLNEDILLQGRNADALHQTRVAIRRLRSAFSLFGDLVEDAQGARIRAELKRMTEPMGQARNLDVFLATTLPTERERHPDEVGLLNLETQHEDQRSRAYEAVQRLLQSAEWRGLVLDLVAWINAGPWLRDGGGGPCGTPRGTCARLRGARTGSTPSPGEEARPSPRRPQPRGPTQGADRCQEAALRGGVLFRLVPGQDGREAPCRVRQSALRAAGSARRAQRHRDRPRGGAGYRRRAHRCFDRLRCWHHRC